MPRLSWYPYQTLHDHSWPLGKEGDMSRKQKVEQALTHVVQFVAHRPAKQKVTGSNPSQGTCLGCGFSPWMGHIQETADPRFFLSLSLSLPFSLKINSLKKKRKKE